MDQIYKRRDSVVAREIAGETLLVPIAGNLADMQRVFALDEVSVAIWGRLDGVRSLRAIVTDIAGEFEVSEEVAAADAERFVGELCEHGLVEQV